MKTTTEMKLVPIAKLVPYVNNARTHSPEQINKLRSSLREFGFINPVIIDRDYGVIAGHGRILAAKEEGIPEVPCVFADHLTEAQKKAYIIADNRMAMDAGWDEELLRVEIEALQAADFDPLLTGFDEKELSKLFDDGKDIQEDDFDVDAELQKPTFTKSGDVWTLGRHRLVCGDSTKEETYAAIMDGRKANLVITDPPYNVNYEGSAGKIKNDNMDGEKFYQFLFDAFSCMEKAMADNASIYVFHADTEGLNFRRAFADAGFYLSGCCIWKKQSLVLGRSPYQWQHEPCLYGWKKKGKHQWYTGRKESTIWEFDTNFRQISNVLQEGIDANGGYLVPDEYDSRLIQVLNEENVMRSLGTAITTSGEHKINIAATKPAAAWIEEGGALTFGDATFDQIILDAHKLHVAVKVTEELLYDNAFNLENYILEQFGKALANAEEDAFINGNGTGQPLGILAETGGAQVGVTTKSSGKVTADEIIDLVYSLKRPYRKNAVFLANDACVAELRKLKDSMGQYLWQPSLQAGEPDRVLGYKVYAFKDVVYKRLIELCTDICKRNSKTKLLWLGDKTKTLNYTPKSDEMVLTVHRWFAAKSCPGNWMYARMGDLAEKVTAQLGGEVKPAQPTPPTAGTVKMGDLVAIAGSTYYSGKTIPSWVRKLRWYVYEVSSDRAVINRDESGRYAIMSPIKVSALSVVSAKPAENYRIHTVVHGDTLWGIAKKYLGNGSRYKEIVSLNGLKSNVLYSGMKLKIPNK